MLSAVIRLLIVLGLVFGISTAGILALGVIHMLVHWRSARSERKSLLS
jgi:hypothetical protein